jgi:hypothetical protein
MKRSVILFTVLSALFLCIDAASHTAEAQGNSRREQRRERQRWKRTARSYVRNPLALKTREEAYQEQISQLTQKNNELTQRYTELQAQLDMCEANNRRCQSRVDSAINAAQRLQSAYEILKEQCESQRAQQNNSGSGDPNMTRGLVYRVQVGAYERFDMTRYNAEGGNFSAETADNLNKYLMGRFRSYANAQAFRDDVRRLGIRDAFVVAYNDGTRISIQDARRIEGGGSAAPAGGGSNNRNNNNRNNSGGGNGGRSGGNEW